MKQSNRKKIGIGLAFIGLFAWPQILLAQEFSLGTEGVESYLSENWVVIGLISLRFLLVLTLIIAGMVGFFSGFNWIFAERNAKKAFENKKRLGNALILVTILFFALMLYRVFVPDYSSLVLP